MRNTECSRIREALRSGAPMRRGGRHLFACPTCRAEVRLNAAWRNFPGPVELEVPEPADERFVRRVMDAVREDRRRQLRNRMGLAAAAALLFFFFAGAGQQTATSLATGAEDSYAELLGPSALEGFLPD